jgi:hypothetical protein
VAALNGCTVTVLPGTSSGDGRIAAASVRPVVGITTLATLRAAGIGEPGSILGGRPCGTRPLKPVRRLTTRKKGILGDSYPVVSPGWHHCSGHR